MKALKDLGEQVGTRSCGGWRRKFVRKQMTKGDSIWVKGKDDSLEDLGVLGAWPHLDLAKAPNKWLKELHTEVFEECYGSHEALIS